MKRLLFSLFLLFGFLKDANAVFIIKHSEIASQPNERTDQKIALSQNRAEHSNFFARAKARLFSKLLQIDERYGGMGGEGTQAAFWARWGFFIWPLGILAIIHGIKGLHSRNEIQQDQAMFGLVFGIIETIATIVVVAWIISFLFFF